MVEYCIRFEYNIRMGRKEQLRTVRLALSEGEKVDRYLKQNSIFESFSSLARVAVLSFIGASANVALIPVFSKEKTSRPVFLWDYDLSEEHVREILSQPGLSDQKRWLIEKILTQTRFEEVFQYLSVNEIQRALPSLKLSEKIRKRWEYAIQYWSKHE